MTLKNVLETLEEGDWAEIVLSPCSTPCSYCGKGKIVKIVELDNENSVSVRYRNGETCTFPLKHLGITDKRW